MSATQIHCQLIIPMIRISLLKHSGYGLGVDNKKIGLKSNLTLNFNTFLSQ